MSHDDDTCPHLIVLGRLEAENARLKAEVERLTAENESLQTKATNIYNAMVVRCKVEEITHKAKTDSIISQGMMSEAMKMVEECVSIKAQVERLTKMCQATSPDGFIHIRDIKHLNSAKEVRK